MSTSDRPLRVLLVSHYYPPHLGGVENVVRQEAVRLAASGVDVTVLTSAERSAVRHEEGVRVVRVAAWNGAERAGVPFPVLSPAAVPAALRWARWADVVHVHDCLYLTSWVAGLAAALTRTPHLLTQHVGLVAHPSAVVRGVQRVVYAVAGRGLLRRARSVFTLNATVAAFVRRYGARPDRARHLPNGVDAELFRPAGTAAERATARRRFGLPEDRPLVLFAGRLVPKKGFDLLLAAHRPADGFDLVFAGDGDTAGLPGQPGVHHVGALSPEELAELYRACDVFALPSTAEGFPLTVQEAMASGLPVVTTDDPGYAPYRLDRSMVRLVPRNADDLRAALVELTGDPVRRAGMADYSRRYATAEFAWEEHVRSLVLHYRDASGAVPR
ncbi:glycosyltransferase family 4 protein [Kitasatospora sp. NPDC092948]|uniref:glycosyltransferase family 4 protein n=1 Tax=Kitasatospora sp. NPDC092948 TaxID=3364088 RepID=UPI00380201FB